ncbi:MAG: SDR family oxidoreductase [Bacteroidota bacterium]
MKVAILGATGFSGQAVLSRLLAEGHEVSALVRNPQKLSIQHRNLSLIVGDVLDPGHMKALLQGQEAVINCLGIGGKGSGKATSLLSEATRVLIQAMKETGTERLIAMSNVGAGDSRTFHPWIFRAVILPVFMRWLKLIIDDKNVMEPLIQESGLAWTIVRCPNITDRPAKGSFYPTLDGKGLKLSITRDDLAQFMVHQLSDHSFLHHSPSISN